MAFRASEWRVATRLEDGLPKSKMISGLPALKGVA